MQRICEICAERFPARRDNTARYCPACRRTLQQERRRYEAEAMSAHRAPRVCVTCGNLFAAAGQQKQCGVCREIAHAALRPHKGAKPVRARRNETNQERIARLAREAREAGMSYGQYVTGMEKGKKK